jgi:arginine decarboxylase-like protein
MVAHHSVLVFDVLGVNEMTAPAQPPEPVGEDDASRLQALWEILGR